MTLHQAIIYLAETFDFQVQATESVNITGGLFYDATHKGEPFGTLDAEAVIHVAEILKMYNPE